MAADELLEGLYDMALPDMAELQIPGDFGLLAFGEPGLLSDPSSLIVYDEAAAQSSAPHAFDPLSWLPPATPEGYRCSTEEAGPCSDAPEPRVSPSATARTAAPKGKIERKAEQNRRAYQRYRERQRLQKEDDRRTIEAMDRQICALQAERSEMSRRIDVLQKLQSLKEELSVSPALPTSPADTAASALTLGWEVAEVYAEALTLLRGLDSSPVDPATLVGLDAAGLFRLSKECTGDCGTLLVRGADPASADGQRLVKACKALHKVSLLMWAAQPALAAALNREFRARCQNSDEKELYPVVVRAMNLSADQKKSLREEYTRGFARSAALHRQRTALLQQLDTQMTSDDGYSTERVTQGMEAARQLQRNMAAEAAVIGDLSHVFGAVITPHQGVCGDLAAWPQSVYMTRLVRYLGTEAEPQDGAAS